ncbi:hypothetical protein Clacol_010544 [Clathrus columnatus]|uniref:Uncharacterized protein n=1 Tax=Clathrus columnatus TaxID=1419009 RepID=A0AAV5ART3_9AGAM|nr:hypothetical protein Clacol_010544 [Clathrus columnatus]
MLPRDDEVSAIHLKQFYVMIMLELTLPPRRNNRQEDVEQVRKLGYVACSLLENSVGVGAYAKLRVRDMSVEEIIALGYSIDRLGALQRFLYTRDVDELQKLTPTGNVRDFKGL